jgi:hypothetical protein
VVRAASPHTPQNRISHPFSDRYLDNPVMKIRLSERYLIRLDV